jgi:hypothetical protein
MSLPYFKNFGWEAEIVTVDINYADMVKDDLLLQSVPPTIKVHRVKALNKKLTSKIGLGSIALRALWFYKQKVNYLLKYNKFDLIYFSTTQFPVCILGPYWKKRFKIPYVIDMQDPWHSEYYQNKSKDKRPSKYWISYPLNKYLEKIAMKSVSGLIGVSEIYIKNLIERYPHLADVPYRIITFGAFETDFQIAREHGVNSAIKKPDEQISIAYVGVAGPVMEKSLITLFASINWLKTEHNVLYKKFKWFFIGTSYAPSGKNTQSVIPIAKKFNVDECVEEEPDRITFYQALQTLLAADALLVIGTDEPNYTASKLYPYLLTNKPLLCIFHPKSPAHTVLEEYNAKYVYHYDDPEMYRNILGFLTAIISERSLIQTYDKEAVKKYSAENITLQQCQFFNTVIDE